MLHGKNAFFLKQSKTLSTLMKVKIQDGNWNFGQ